MNLADSDVIQLQGFINRLVQQSFAYRNITGQDLAPTAWTPVLSFDTPGDLAVVYSLQTGYGSRIGKKVFIDFGITTTTFTHTTAAGNLRITGLPFTSSATTNIRYTGNLSWQGITKANFTHMSCHVAASETLIRVTASGSGQNLIVVTYLDMPTGGNVSLRGSLMYESA